MERLSDKWRAKIKTTSDDYVPKEDLTRAVASQIGSFNGTCIAACIELETFAAKHSEEYNVRRMELIVTLLDASCVFPPLKLENKDIPANGETFFWNGNLDNFVLLPSARPTAAQTIVGGLHQVVQITDRTSRRVTIIDPTARQFPCPFLAYVLGSV